ncbi:Major facilitator superfamily protein isoform 2 [Hibiscus syriacus]|uniref:Major facilitator superfamily protein isoform 2 n=1 Tax=Hibiscus syriacus TaxID=106335 RepID=A0A6A2Y025_HIBSY|nr:Major facilitator superfamily protein isoform 2 [Hibiscus syriacus]
MVLVESLGERDGSNDEVVVDYRGIRWIRCEFSERICMVGISMNLVTYNNNNNNKIQFILDRKSAYFGGEIRNNIAISASIIALGVILLTVATTIPRVRPPPYDGYRIQHHECIEANSRQLAFLYAVLYTIALGGGGIKSNVSGFGSNQFDVKDPKDEKAMIFFFNRFYFGVSIVLGNKTSNFPITRLVRMRNKSGKIIPEIDNGVQPIMPTSLNCCKSFTKERKFTGVYKTLEREIE